MRSPCTCALLGLCLLLSACQSADRASHSNRSLCTLSTRAFTLSFGYFMERSRPPTMFEAQHPNSPRRRPQLTLNGARFVVSLRGSSRLAGPRQRALTLARPGTRHHRGDWRQRPVVVVVLSPHSTLPFVCSFPSSCGHVRLVQATASSLVPTSSGDGRCDGSAAAQSAQVGGRC